MIETKRKYFHPGVLIKDAIEELRLSQSEFALNTGLSIENVSMLINGESNITFDVADKLSHFFHNSVEGWINLQNLYDAYLKKHKYELHSYNTQIYTYIYR